MDTQITSGEAALLIGCTTGTVGNLATRGRLRWRRLKNGARVFRLDDVLQFAEERRRNPERRGRPIKLRDLIQAVKVSSVATAVASSEPEHSGNRAAHPSSLHVSTAAASRK